MRVETGFRSTRLFENGVDLLILLFDELPELSYYNFVTMEVINLQC